MQLSLIAHLSVAAFRPATPLIGFTIVRNCGFEISEPMNRKKAFAYAGNARVDGCQCAGDKMTFDAAA
jgi:hypothetical protein